MSINERLLQLQKKACFSDTDMATWFNCNRSTMRTWLEGGVTPSSYRQPQIDDTLSLLERAIDEGGHFPVPLSVTQFKRKDYIQGVKDDLTKRISASRPAQ